MHMATLVSELAPCPIFQDMSAQERQEVVRLMESATYPEGDVILREGKSVQRLWLIVRGQCEVVKATTSGTEQQLAVLEPLNVFGEVSFFCPGPHSASVRTLSEVEVMVLRREGFDELLAASPPAAYKLAFNTMQILAERFRRMDEWTCGLVEKLEASKHREEWREFRSKLYSDWPF